MMKKNEHLKTFENEKQMKIWVNAHFLKHIDSNKHKEAYIYI